MKNGPPPPRPTSPMFPGGSNVHFTEAGAPFPLNTVLFGEMDIFARLGDLPVIGRWGASKRGPRRSRDQLQIPASSPEANFFPGPRGHEKVQKKKNLAVFAKTAVSLETFEKNGHTSLVVF